MVFLWFSSREGAAKDAGSLVATGSPNSSKSSSGATSHTNPQESVFIPIKSMKITSITIDRCLILDDWDWSSLYNHHFTHIYIYIHIYICIYIYYILYIIYIYICITIFIYTYIYIYIYIHVYYSHHYYRHDNYYCHSLLPLIDISQSILIPIFITHKNGLWSRAAFFRPILWWRFNFTKQGETSRVGPRGDFGETMVGKCGKCHEKMEVAMRK